MRLIYFYLFVILLLASCIKEVELDIDTGEDNIVVNSLITPDSLISVIVTLEKNVYKEGIHTTIPNADVRLWEDDIPVDTLKFNNGWYISDIRPKENSRYKVQVDVLDKVSASAEDIVPTAPRITGLSYSDSSYFKNEFAYARLDIDFYDPPEKNYYELFLIVEIDSADKKQLIDDYLQHLDSNGWEYDSSYYYSFYHNSKWLHGMLSFNPAIQAEGKEFSDHSYHSLFFSDTYFIKSNCRIAVYIFHYESIFMPKKKYYTVILHTISEEYYHYRKSLHQYNLSQKQNYWTPTNSFSRLYSNIDGGTGLFAAYSSDTDTLIVE